MNDLLHFFKKTLFDFLGVFEDEQEEGRVVLQENAYKIDVVDGFEDCVFGQILLLRS